MLLRLDLMRNLYLFRGYGKDALLLSVLAYNVWPYAILGTSKRPKIRLLRKIERGDRNIYANYVSFCRWKGRQMKSIKFRRQVKFDLFFMKYIDGGKWKIEFSVCLHFLLFVTTFFGCKRQKQLKKVVTYHFFVILHPKQQILSRLFFLTVYYRSGRPFSLC